MSRSALWRQEGNVKQREKEAEELFRLAVEEGRSNRAKNLVPTWGPDDSFHLNPMLLQNIIKSPYFQKCCRDITDWNTLVDQVYYDVKHVEPWAQGSNREPSSAFCLLLRLLTLRCTEKQMHLLLTHTDSPYIRAIGFLYLRYAGDPKCVYKWIEPYLYDDETISAGASAAKQGGSAETIGGYVRRLFTDKNYYGTILPRLPIHIERDIQVKLLQAEKIEERAKKHALNSRAMSCFQRLGSKVMALYGDDENPVTWYEAVVDRVITEDTNTQHKLHHPKFVVTFPEYGNTETVMLGEMEMMGVSLDNAGSSAPDRGGNAYSYRSQHGGREDGDRKVDPRRGYRHDRGHSEGGRDHHGYRDNRWQRGNRGSAPPTASDADLYEEVRRRERETVTSSNHRNAAARRPPSTKASLSATDYGKRSRSPDRYHRPPAQQRRQHPPTTSAPPASNMTAAREKTPEELAAIRAKKQRLLAKYG